MTGVMAVGEEDYAGELRDHNGSLYDVTAIGAKALSKNMTVKKLTIGAKVTTIGKSAFKGCKKLKTIKIQTSGLKKIGKKAFKGVPKKATVKVPKAKKKAYKKLLKKGGLPKTAKVK